MLRKNQSIISTGNLIMPERNSSDAGRRHGIECFCTPYQERWRCCLGWSISQCAKRLSMVDTNSPITQDSGKRGFFADTFEEGNKIVSRPYANGWNERPLSNFTTLPTALIVGLPRWLRIEDRGVVPPQRRIKSYDER